MGSSGSKGKEKVSELEIGPRFGPAVSQKSSGPFLTHFEVQPFGPSVMNSHGPAKFQLTKGLLGKSILSWNF